MDNVSNRSELPLQLFLEDDSVLPLICHCVIFLVYVGLGVQVPLAISGWAYYTCKTCTNYHTARCSYCAEPTPRSTGCKKTRVRWAAKYCSFIEWLTVGLLVDIFHTPHLKKELKGGKRCLRVGKEFILELEKEEFISSILFAIITGLFSNYLLKFILDWFIKVSQTCINKGDFGTPATCYTGYSAMWYKKINCTVWNEYSELMVELSGGLLCFSVYYNLLSTLAELAGLIGLQIIMMQFLIPPGARLFGKRFCCRQCLHFICWLFAFLIILGPLFTDIYLFQRVKLFLGLFYNQFPAMYVVTLCSMLISVILGDLTPDKLTPGLEPPGHLTEGSYHKKMSTRPLYYKTVHCRRKHSTRRSRAKSYPREFHVRLCSRKRDECTNEKEINNA